MTTFTPQDPEYAERVRASFARQPVMKTMGVRLTRVEPGLIELEMPYSAELTQQHGYLHAGVVTTIVDSACGYAAFSLMPADSTVLSVEFKVNLIAPADGVRFVALGQVVKAGRTLTVCEGRVFAYDEHGREKLTTMMVATMITLRGRADGGNEGDRLTG